MGIIRGISKSTNYTLQTSGTVFSASILRGLMKDNWDNSNGEVATDVFVGSALSDRMDEFTSKSTVVVTGEATTVVNALDVFETGLGKVRKHTHRYVQTTSDANARILGVRPEKLRIAYLQKPFIDTGLARQGDYEARAVVGKKNLPTLKSSNSVNIQLTLENTELRLCLKFVGLVGENSKQATLKQSFVPRNVMV